jgi:hypothetical protein
MATKLTKPISRETDVTVFEKGSRPLIVTLQGDCITFKVKGLRSSLQVLPIGKAYAYAIKERK